MPTVKITDVRTAAVQGNFEWILVRVYTDGGLMGLGECNWGAGVELALWDLKGKALNTPIYNLLGGRYRDRIRIYADCGHGERTTPEAWAERAQEAKARGFTALKFDIDNKWGRA